MSTRQEIDRQRKELPIYYARDALLHEVAVHDALVVVGETGSGKTTQLPQYLAETAVCGDGVVAVTQPRRVAAVTIARRVAEEAGVELGQEVGYRVRFEDVTSGRTQLLYMTDGMLLREAMVDPTLSKYSVIILDEAHERTLHTDILFGLVRRVQKARPGSVKVIVMSATLDADLFANYFQAKVVYIAGRQFPVDILYTPVPEPDYLDAALVTALQIHVDEPIGGDILVFLTGQEEIESLEKMLNERAARLKLVGAPELIVCPIFSALSSDVQMRAFERAPQGSRKVILATNIAETSITISGVRYVVDCGLVKARGYNSKIKIESLMVVPVSKAQARQRAGRAGREAPGKCFRLYTEEVFMGLKENTVPEIKRCNLSTVVLQLKALGVDDVFSFEYMDAPPADSIKRAFELLLCLGALDKQGHLADPLGKRMAMFPVDPTFAKVLITSADYGCSEEALTVVAMLSIESPFFAGGSRSSGESKGSRERADASRARFCSPEGDHITYLSLYKEYAAQKTSQKKVHWCRQCGVDYKTMAKVESVREQLAEYYKSIGLPLVSCGDSGSLDPLRRCFVAGFFMNAAAVLPDRTFRTLIDNKLVSIHPSSVLHGKRPNCVIYNELILTGKPYMRGVLAIDSSWLVEVAPHVYSKRVQN
eukprot:m51a1_g7596 putative atp-dependent rna helicase dhx8 (652) ;mRNA; f:224239-227355